ncbi:MAG: prepilin-type N-terminal cleavage/methylation domain-containing protein [Verrucomicrobiae bacterium]|nr:prepilin-type N-terminal cleavage/methylation domain-containing protein [Verrucomicrobiae bacterium]
MKHGFPLEDPRTSRHTSGRAFTFVEMLVAMSISAMFIGTAAMVLSTITQNAKHHSTIQEISIGASVNQNFYGLTSGSVTTPSAPNYGRLGFVHEIRDQFYEDVSRSEGVYCLARGGLNSLHPEWLSWPYTDPTVTKPVLDTPEAFRQYLATVEPTSAAVFTAYRNVPPSSAPNTSIYLTAPTDQADYIKVQAVYEIDYVTTTSPAGVYASVRRYKNGAMTHYYDVFFENATQATLFPSVVHFESRSRLAKSEAASITRFKKGVSGPFYLLWLPDPSIDPLKANTTTAPTDTSLPLEAYGHLAGKTGFMLTAPLFPTL